MSTVAEVCFDGEVSVKGLSNDVAARGATCIADLVEQLVGVWADSHVDSRRSAFGDGALAGPDPRAPPAARQAGRSVVAVVHLTRHPNSVAHNRLGLCAPEIPDSLVARSRGLG